MQSRQFECLSIGLLERYAEIWGFDRISREDLIALSVFPLLILAMKRVDVESLPENHDSMYYKLKTILLFVMEELKASRDSSSS
jgi:hypothetical protein